MKKYKRRIPDTILVWEWDGEESTLTEINDIIKMFDDRENYYGAVRLNHTTILLERETADNGTQRERVNIGEFVVFDTSDTFDSLKCMSKKLLNEKYEEI